MSKVSILTVLFLTEVLVGANQMYKKPINLIGDVTLNGSREGNNRSALGQKIISYLINETRYNWAVRPIGAKNYQDFHKNGSLKGDMYNPVTVNATVLIMSLSSFDDVLMQFQAQFRFQQEWFDERLVFEHDEFQENDTINLAHDQQLWTPDTFFQNEKDGHVHMIDKPNLYMKLRPNGWVKYNKRLTMDFSCPMHLQLFPHDNQTCVIEFSSYAYTERDIILQWSPKSVIFHERANKSLPKFSITQYESGLCTSATATGTYSCLRITLYLQREFSYFLLQLYIPSCMLVSVACVSFWIDWRAAPARVPLTIVTLLTITTQAHGINANLPPVSYTKAIDIWIGACIVFIFSSLIEYSIVNYVTFADILVGTNEEKRKAKHAHNKMDGFPMNHFMNKQYPLEYSSETPLLNKGTAFEFYGSLDELIPPLKDPSFLFQKTSNGSINKNCSTICYSNRSVPIPEDSPAFECSTGPVLRRRYLPNTPETMMIAKKPNQSVKIIEKNNQYCFQNGHISNGVNKLNNEVEFGDCFEAKEYASYRRQRKEAIRHMIENALNHNWNENELVPEMRRARLPESQFESLATAMKVATRAERIDMISRFLFPLGFLCFNVVYWSLYLPPDY